MALRWRTEKEVVVGKGQFECGNKKCSIKDNLKSWEVNFGYEEHGEKRNALVKVRLCPECSNKLNYSSQKREVKRKKALKRLGTNAESTQRASSSNQLSEVTIKIEEEDPTEIKEDENKDAEIPKEKINETEIWKGKVVEGVEKSREEEFEEYLADLFL